MNGPFVFTVVASGTLSDTLGPDIVVDPVFTAQGNIAITYTSHEAGLTPVPEPASLALLGSGLFGLAAIRRRRRR